LNCARCEERAASCGIRYYRLDFRFTELDWSGQIRDWNASVKAALRRTAAIRVPVIAGSIMPMAAIVAMAASVGAGKQSTAVAALLRTPAVKAALDAARASEPQTIEQQIQFCEVPAPPFKEGARAAVLKRAFEELGLHSVHVDRVGNVLGDRRGASGRPHVVVAAHLDTVFPEDTVVKVRREGSLLRGPGIGDNCRGLAVLVAAARALRQADVQTPGTITFVANVGEEGVGYLRGTKELFKGEMFKGEMKDQIDRFLSIDNAGLLITNRAVGSRRFRVTFKGPGGHSFGAFGLANPAHALGRAVAKIAEFQVSGHPRTTFNVGRIGGGTSVNAIPFEVWMEVDLRSSDLDALGSLDAKFHRAVDAAVAEENARWGVQQTVTAVNELVGDRPVGLTPAIAPIVQTAQAVARVLGLDASLGEGSTDANVPMSLKIPAITIGGGGRSSDSHAPGEAFDSTDSWKGTQNAVLLMIALAQP
jgi:acetylornithine deacetylase/succinyl-diaminopimelate desuccinylase-like protein